MESDEAVVELFNANGAAITLEDLQNMCEKALKASGKDEMTELTESELDDVSGGISAINLSIGAAKVLLKLLQKRSKIIAKGMII